VIFEPKRLVIDTGHCVIDGTEKKMVLVPIVGQRTLPGEVEDYATMAPPKHGEFVDVISHRTGKIVAFYVKSDHVPRCIAYNDNYLYTLHPFNLGVLEGWTLEVEVNACWFQDYGNKS